MVGEKLSQWIADGGQVLRKQNLYRRSGRPRLKDALSIILTWSIF